jgi:hypothetical protein
MEPTSKRIEGSFSQGWPVALFIIALVVGSFVTAGLIHKKTFRSPNDPTAQYRKEKTGVGGSESASGKNAER